MQRFILCALCSVVCALACEAQWVGGRCRGQAPVGAVQAQSYSWARIEGHREQIQLLENGRQIGTWRYDLAAYYPIVNGDWSQTPAEVPAGAPALPAQEGCKDCPCAACKTNCACRAAGAPCGQDCTCFPQANFGIDLGKLVQAGEEKVTFNGRPVTKAVAESAVRNPGDARIPDDAKRLRLTVIGDDALRAAVLKDLASSAELAPWRDSLLVQGYPSTHWAVAKAGFHTSGRPTIYLQSADGKVLHRQDDYDDGAKGLAEAIRKADPNYKPEQDPDKRKPEPAPILPPDLGQIPELAVLGAIAAVAFLVFRKK